MDAIQICTATFEQLHDISIVKDGFPMDRTIHAAKILIEQMLKKSLLVANSQTGLTILIKPF